MTPASQDSLLKRKFSLTGLSADKKIIKRRASKACASCRSRKVRCNVVEHGAPCTNCRLDEVDCVLTESKRKRRISPDWSANNHNHPLPSCIGDTNHLHAPLNPIIPQATALDAISDISNPTSNALEPLNFSEHVPHPLYRRHSVQRPSRAAMESIQQHRLTHSDPGADCAYASPSATSFSPKMMAFKRSSAVLLPGYLKPVPSRLGDDERGFLQRKGALVIPELELRDALFQGYVEFIHPYTPILDICDFVAKMTRGDASLGRLSLLVFQAIMFVGSAYVSLDVLERHGYQSRKIARAQLYAKVRHLYDFDYEMDRFSQIQALLLMTSWYETPDDKKDAWHWMGIVISTSYTVGMHRNPANANMDVSQERQWKRIWWSAIIRDRMLALGLRRPTRIKVEDSDVPLLTVQDFQLDILPDTSFLPDCLVLHDLAVQRAVAETCMQLTKLCLCIGDVLTAQYSEQDGQTMRSTSNMQLFLPRSFQSKSSVLEYCKDGLQSWADQLPDSLRLDRDERLADAKRLPASIILHRGLLHMMFFTTLSALHRPQVLQSVPTSGLPSGTDEIMASRMELRRASVGTMKVAKMLIQLDYVRFLPMSGVTTLQSAIVNQLLDVKSIDDQVRQDALQGFCYCIRAIYDLRDCYNAVEHTLALIEAAVRRADIRVPIVDARANDMSNTAVTTPPMATDADLFTEKKATSSADLLQAGVYERLISAALATPQLMSLPKDHSLITVGVERETETAARESSAFQYAQEYGIARKLDSLLTIPLPVPEQHGDGMDYWSYAPASPINLTMPYDFDMYFNCVPTPGAEDEVALDPSLFAGAGFEEEQLQFKEKEEMQMDIGDMDELLGGDGVKESGDADTRFGDEDMISSVVSWMLDDTKLNRMVEAH